jgi:hypothetical protein
VPKLRTPENSVTEKCLLDDPEDRTQLDKKLNDTKTYVGEAQLILLSNYEEFDPKGFKDDSIKKHSKIMKRQFSMSKPAFSRNMVRVNELDDETSYINYGQEVSRQFINFNMKPNEISSEINYPEKYKFFSVHFSLDQDIYKIERSTYDLLDLIGDIGGVFEFFSFALKALCLPFQTMRLYALIANRLFLLP